MKADLIRQIDALCRELRAEGYEAQATINDTRGTLLITAKPLSEQNKIDLKQNVPQIRKVEGG